LPIEKLKPGLVTIEAVIKQARGRYVRRGLHITEAVASDKSGSVRLVWFTSLTAKVQLIKALVTLYPAVLNLADKG